MTTHTTVEAAGKRRQALNDAMVELESAAAAASGAYWWRERVEAALVDLGEAVDAHIEEVEASDGLLAQILDESPRLSGYVQLMRTEHQELHSSIESLWRTISGTQDNASVADIRRRVMALLGRLSMHRQRGSDLVYEAYNVDIAAGD